VTKNPDTLPTGSDPSGKCPRCNRISNFEVIRQGALAAVYSRAVASTGTGVIDPPPPVRNSRTVEQVSVIKCMGCNRLSVVIEAEPGGTTGLQGVLWWPTPEHDVASRTHDVPVGVADAFAEGCRCATVHAPNAAVAMFRTAVAQIVEDKASVAARSERDLYRRIEKMAEEGALFNNWSTWAHHIRTVGNAGAHGEKFDPVPIEQARELQRFVAELINTLYVQPARLAAAMAPTPTTTPRPEASAAQGTTGITPGAGDSNSG
jgi:Domain of unknown function (DUF4145)